MPWLLNAHYSETLAAHAVASMTAETICIDEDTLMLRLKN